MGVYAYISNRYVYDYHQDNLLYVSGRIVELHADTKNEAFLYTYMDANKVEHTIYVHVIDFLVDAAEDANSTVEVWVHNYDPPFSPKRGWKKDVSSRPFKYVFCTPPIDGPDFKWGVNDPVGEEAPTPGYMLRVTVKRK